ncbi:MAG: hypothetical protein JRI25_25685 [Deltaproteobacteria bacterium]|nr:hypothetical protein [Deltaproteobacteria bacterium]
MPLPTWLTLAALLTGCASRSQAEEPLPDPDSVRERIVATLDEAQRLDRDGRDTEARAAWRRAHVTFETALEPQLREVLPDREVAITEYQFARIRSEIDQARGRPAPVARKLGERLDTQVSVVQTAREQAP